MRRSVNKAGIVKASLKIKAGNTVVIGGPDFSCLDSKQAVLEQRIEEAKQRATDEAKIIIESADIEAKRLLGEAENHKQEIEDQAYQDGFKKGTIDATNKVDEDLASTLKEASNILEAITQERKECLEDEETRVYKIIVEIARKLLKKDYELSQEMSLEFIKSAISRLEHKSTVNLLLNADIANKINAVKNKIVDEIPGLENLTISAADGQELGDLILESNKERLDLRLDSMLDELVFSITNKSKPRI